MSMTASLLRFPPSSALEPVKLADSDAPMLVIDEVRRSVCSRSTAVTQVLPQDCGGSATPVAWPLVNVTIWLNVTGMPDGHEYTWKLMQRDTDPPPGMDRST